MTTAVENTDSETLHKWLVSNTALIGQYDPAIERVPLQRCLAHIRDIKAELVHRHGAI